MLRIKVRGRSMVCLLLHIFGYFSDPKRRETNFNGNEKNNMEKNVVSGTVSCHDSGAAYGNGETVDGRSCK